MKVDSDTRYLTNFQDEHAEVFKQKFDCPLQVKKH